MTGRQHLTSEAVMRLDLRESTWKFFTRHCWVSSEAHEAIALVASPLLMLYLLKGYCSRFYNDIFTCDHEECNDQKGCSSKAEAGADKKSEEKKVDEEVKAAKEPPQESWAVEGETFGLRSLLFRINHVADVVGARERLAKELEKELLEDSSK